MRRTYRRRVHNTTMQRRRRFRRRRLRLRIARPRSRFTVHNFKVTQNTTYGFFQNQQLVGGWQAYSIESATDWTSPTGKPHQGLNLRFAMFGDRASPYVYPYDYYQIRGVRVELTPAYDIYNRPFTIGSTIIDKDGNIQEVKDSSGVTPWGIDPYGTVSSRRSYNPHRYHKRFFIPKPTIQGSGSPVHSTWFLSGRQNPWLNVQQDQVVHYGMGISLRQPENNAQYVVAARLTFYIRFGQFQGF